MTAEKMMELADELEKCPATPFYGMPGDLKFVVGFAMTEADRVLILAALRSSAVAGAREALIEQCAKVAADCSVRFYTSNSSGHLQHQIDYARSDIVDAIRALQSEPVQPAGKGEEKPEAPRAMDCCGTPAGVREWQPIETAPKDGTEIIGLWKCKAYSVRWQQDYVKWPHEEGGPTFRGGWSAETWDQHMPCEPSRWLPMPPEFALPSDPVRRTTQPIQRDSTARLDSAATSLVTDGSVQSGDIITYALKDGGLGKIISHTRPITQQGGEK